MEVRGTVVVTGADGFVGRALVPFLAARGAEVRGLVRALDGATAARADFLSIGDLAEIDERTSALVLGGACAVVHLAARVHRPRTHGDDEAAAMRRTNVAATQRLARAAAAAGVAHFVFASTVKVNGRSRCPAVHSARAIRRTRTTPTPRASGRRSRRSPPSRPRPACA